MIARLHDDAFFEEEREGQISRSDSSHMCVVKGGNRDSGERSANYF